MAIEVTFGVAACHSHADRLRKTIRKMDKVAIGRVVLPPLNLNDEVRIETRIVPPALMRRPWTVALRIGYETRAANHYVLRLYGCARKSRHRQA